MLWVRFEWASKSLIKGLKQMSKFTYASEEARFRRSELCVTDSLQHSQHTPEFKLQRKMRDPPSLKPKKVVRLRQRE